MRGLIRPTLFLVARLGLIFAVVAWILGQWWQGYGFAYYTSVVIDRTGIGIGVEYVSLVERWEIREEPERPIIQNFLDGVGFSPDVSHLSFYAVGFAHSFPSGVGMGIKHWLVVTIFALFYGVLKWVYRKRGKELADE